MFVKHPRKQTLLPEPLRPGQESVAAAVLPSPGSPRALLAPSQDAHCLQRVLTACVRWTRCSWGLDNLSHLTGGLGGRSRDGTSRSPPLAFSHRSCNPKGDLCANPTASRPSQRTDPLESLRTPTVANLHIRRVPRSMQRLTHLPRHRSPPLAGGLVLGQDPRQQPWGWERVPHPAEGRDCVTRWGRLAPNILSCGTWCKPETCSMNAQRCYI